MGRLLQLELWTDFESAGGARLLIIPTDQVFAATRRRDLKSADDLTLTIDAALTGLFGGGFSQVAPAIFTRNVDGRVTLDDFKRADSDTVGPPSFPTGQANWTEIGEAAASDARISGGFLDFPSGGNIDVLRSVPAQPTEFIIQANSMARVSNAFPRLSAYNNAISPPDRYGIALDNFQDQVELRIIVSGAVEGQITPSFTVATNAAHTLRMVGRSNAPNFDLTAYVSSALADLDVEGAAVSQVGGTLTDSSPILTSTSYGFSPSRATRFGKFVLCSVDFTMTGLATGDTIEIDGSTPATESGGTAVLPMDGVPLPGQTCTVKNSSAQTKGTLTPTTGLFGGDSYSLDAAQVSSTFQRGSERRVVRGIFENMAKPGFAGAIEEWRIT